MASSMLLVDLWTVAAATMCGAISMRIVCWRRTVQRYRLGMSLAAWVLAMSSGSYAMYVGLYTLYGRPVPEVSPLLVVILLIVMVQVFRARGNVAAFFRVDWDSRWSGVERRKAPR